jgi:hypothetical protein
VKSQQVDRTQEIAGSSPASSISTVAGNKAFSVLDDTVHPLPSPVPAPAAIGLAR